MTHSNNTENQDSVTQNDNVYQNNTDLDEQLYKILGYRSNDDGSVLIHPHPDQQVAKLQHHIKIAEKKAYKKGYIDGGLTNEPAQR